MRPWNEGIQVEPARHRYYRQTPQPSWPHDPAAAQDPFTQEILTEPGVTVTMPESQWQAIETAMTQLSSRHQHPAVWDAWRQYCMVVALTRIEP